MHGRQQEVGNSFTLTYLQRLFDLVKNRSTRELRLIYVIPLLKQLGVLSSEEVWSVADEEEAFGHDDELLARDIVLEYLGQIVPKCG